MWFLLPLLLLLPFTAERYGLVCCSLFHSTKVWWFWLYSRNKRKKNEGEQQKNKIIENYFDIAMRNKFFFYFLFPHSDLSTRAIKCRNCMRISYGTISCCIPNHAVVVLLPPFFGFTAWMIVHLPANHSSSRFRMSKRETAGSNEPLAA